MILLASEDPLELLALATFRMGTVWLLVVVWSLEMRELLVRLRRMATVWVRVVWELAVIVRGLVLLVVRLILYLWTNLPTTLGSLSCRLLVGEKTCMFCLVSNETLLGMTMLFLFLQIWMRLVLCLASRLCRQSKHLMRLFRHDDIVTLRVLLLTVVAMMLLMSWLRLRRTILVFRVRSKCCTTATVVLRLLNRSVVAMKWIGRRGMRTVASHQDT